MESLSSNNIKEDGSETTSSTSITVIKDPPVERTENSKVKLKNVDVDASAKVTDATDSNTESTKKDSATISEAITCESQEAEPRTVSLKALSRPAEEPKLSPVTTTVLSEPSKPDTQDRIPEPISEEDLVKMSKDAFEWDETATKDTTEVVKLPEIESAPITKDMSSTAETAGSTSTFDSADASKRQTRRKTLSTTSVNDEVTPTPKRAQKLRRKSTLHKDDDTIMVWVLPILTYI